MATVSATGLLSPSPSVTELDQAGDSNAGVVKRELNTTSVILNGSIKTDEGTEGAVSVEEVDPTTTARRDGQDTTDLEVADDTQTKKQEDPDPLISSNETDEVVVLEAYSSDSGTDSGSMGVTKHPARRRKYIRGYNAYVMSLEQRITQLERNRPSSSPAPRSRQSSESSESRPDSVFSVEPIRVVIPELKRMTWEEYLVRKGRIITDDAYAIDVLIDEPILFHQRTRKKHGHDGAPAIQAIEIPPSAARRCEGLPSRIRINSEMILHYLWKISKRRFPQGKPGRPRVLLRPYKMLYLFENELRFILADLETKINEKKPGSSGSDKESEQQSETKEGHVTTPHHTGDETNLGKQESVAEVSVPTQDPTREISKALESDADLSDEESKNENVGSGKKPTTETIDNEEPPAVKSFDERCNGEEGISDLKCLIKFIDEYLRPIQNEFDTCQREKVRFTELWHLLKPDQLLYVKEKNCPQHVWRVVQAIGGRPYLSPHGAPPATGPPVQPTNAGPLYETPEGVPSRRAIAAGYDEISPFVIDCEYIDYNGVRFGPIFRKFHIDPFQDEMDIKALTVVPFKYAKKYGLVDEEQLQERGKKFLKFTEAGHRYHSGRTLTRSPLGAVLLQTDEGYHRPGPPVPISEETVESEVIVDFDRTFNSNPTWCPRLGEDIIFEVMDSRETSEQVYEQFDTDNSESIDYDMEWDRQMRNDIMAIINVQTQRYFSKDEIPKGNDILLLPSRVFAFLLRSRKWAALDINNVRPIKARQNGFEDLELPSGHKDVVQALVQTHFRRTSKRGRSHSDDDDEDEEQFDLVRDKGKGLIILLHGAPGVGKTSTAECVAESNNVPLLPITCGDLGITAQDVERKLEMNFRLAQAWGCVLLLDEADVFLAQRSSADLERNAVVSVFLRVLEYYEGILFLTTNRVGAFDEAFKSRIHLSLFYPWLNAVQTIKIWDMHMRRIKERIKAIEIDKEQILAYASLHFDFQCRLTGGTGWNGRQIRNAFQSATALAQFESKEQNVTVHLQVRHFEIVAKAAAEFDDYLIRTTGYSDAERAAFNMLRTDSFNPNPRNPMSWESLTQARGGGPGSAHMTYGGGVGGAAQAAFGGQNQSAYGGGQQGMQGMNPSSYSTGMNSGMPFQPSGYGMQFSSPAPATFMGGGAGPAGGQPQQMWPLHHQGQPGMSSLQQGGMASLSREISQVQEGGVGQGQQAPGPGPATGPAGLQAGMQNPQGFGATPGYGQYAPSGQQFSR